MTKEIDAIWQKLDGLNKKPPVGAITPEQYRARYGGHISSARIHLNAMVDAGEMERMTVGRQNYYSLKKGGNR